MQSPVMGAMTPAAGRPAPAPAGQEHASEGARAAAREGAQARRDSIRERAAFNNKHQLVTLLLGQSPAVLRIPHAGSEQARRELDAARAAFGRASEEAKAGRLDAAIAALDDALRRIVSASHMEPGLAPAAECAVRAAPWQTVQQEQEHGRYDK